MPLNEKVLNSYLQRVFKANIVQKKTCQTAYIAMENMTWPISKFKAFCLYTLYAKIPFRIYEAKLGLKNERMGVHPQA